MKIDTTSSRNKLKAVREVEAPFNNGEKGMEIDSTKLIKMWAANAEAMQAVGAGFESVVASINSLLDNNEVTLDDNAKTRKEARLTRTFVLYGVIAYLVLGMAILFGISQSMSRAVDDMHDLVRSQGLDIEQVQKTLEADKKD